MSPTEPPRRWVCGAVSRMPVDLVALMPARIPDTADPRLWIRTSLRCLLEEHPTGAHRDVPWALDNPTRGEEWADGCLAERVLVLPDCDTSTGASRSEHS
ncbi:hypothetical protein ACFRI7_07000 [Streptomyces sp. NPDC056716]|uniref:hypothetical protein n=1 Tax=unclassified Streptomyces TaxID=2593676 RepID=UPI0036CA8DF3